MNATDKRWNALSRVRQHFAAHLDVAWIDGNEQQASGARALLADVDVLRKQIEYSPAELAGFDSPVTHALWELMTDQESEAADWLRDNENEDPVWAAIADLIDRLERLAEKEEDA